MYMNRCSWVNENNDLYVKYHDEEWGVPIYDDNKLFELLVLESFQAGLSWECVLNKRESFRKALDNFNPLKISNYSEEKISTLLNNKDIIRSRRKIERQKERQKDIKRLGVCNRDKSNNVVK